MLRRRERFYHQVLQVMDAVLLAAAFCEAHFFRATVLSEVSWINFGSIEPLQNYLWLIAICLLGGTFILGSQGFYQIRYPYRFQAVFFQALRGVLFLWLVLLALIVILHIPQRDVSRAVLLLFIPLATFSLMARDAAYRGWLRQRGRSRTARQYVMVCGSRADQEKWDEVIRALPSHDFEVRARLDLREETLNEFIRQLHRENIDVVIFEFNHALMIETNRAIQACAIEGVHAWVATDFLQTTLAHPHFDEFLGRPLLVYRTGPESSWQLLVKGVFDRVSAAFLLSLFSPVMLLVALGIGWTSGSPVVFRQIRSGRHGRPFVMYKFRTMTTHAEQLQHELAVHNEMSGPVFKMADDPRITPLGCWLRKFSLDETPQLWNVLRGEMSLVGPRPLPVRETENFVDLAQRRRLSVKPGLTCLWQVAGRSQITDFRDWVRLDLYYIDHWSLWFDLKILLKTVAVVLLGRGAK